MIAEEVLEEGFAKAISDDLKFACVAFRETSKSVTITEKEILHRLKTIYSRSQIKGLNKGLLYQLTFENLCISRAYPQFKVSLESQFSGQREKIESVTLLIQEIKKKE